MAVTTIRPANPATITITSTVTSTVTSYVVVVYDHTGKKIAEFPLNPGTINIETLFYAAYNPKIIDTLLSTIPPPPPNAGLSQPPREAPKGLAVRIWARQWFDYISRLLDIEQRKTWLKELAVQRGKTDLLEEIERADTLDELYKIQKKLE